MPYSVMPFQVRLSSEAEGEFCACATPAQASKAAIRQARIKLIFAIPWFMMRIYDAASVWRRSPKARLLCVRCMTLRVHSHDSFVTPHQRRTAAPLPRERPARRAGNGVNCLLSIAYQFNGILNRL